ncbi:MAG: NosD domain-containing protein [Alphaproteobacteria bacterium]
MHAVRAAIAAAFALLPLAAAAQSAPQIEVLRVTKIADNGEGSLRWAIERNNTAPGRFRIEIDPEGAGPHVIKPSSPLPAIKGPVRIEGTPWRRTGAFVAIDGAGFIEDKGQRTCAGASPGQYGANVRTTTNPGLAAVDTQGVEIRGLEIRNFCIGVLIHRASGNTVEDTRIVASRGGAGVMLTGDDGNGGSTATTTMHNKVQRNEFVDNGDGLELTRGAAFNLVANNIFRSTDANPEPSQGIEILLGHDNTIVGNRFEGYSDGIQVNGGNRNYIGGNVFTDNALALSMTGEGNVVHGNTITGNAVGVALRPAARMGITRITHNVIHSNGKDVLRCWSGGSCDPKLRRGGIIFGIPAQEHAAYVGERGGGVPVDPSKLTRICPDGEPECQGPPNHGIAPPVIEKVVRDGTKLTATGRVQTSVPLGATVELFGNRNTGDTEGEVFLGETRVSANSQSTFTITVDAPIGSVPTGFTATVTTTDGATSEFSRPIGLSD